MANNNTKRKNNLGRKATKTKDRRVISSCPARNMQEIVLHNPQSSATKHVPIDASKPFLPYKKDKCEWVYPEDRK